MSGAIAILKDNKVLNIFEIPVMSEEKNKRQLNSALLANLIKQNIIDDEEVAIVVEQVNAMPGQGVASMFNFGQTFGAIKGISCHIRITDLFCKTLQNGRNILNSLIHQKTQAEQKQLKCIRNYRVNSQKKDVNKSDAIMITEIFQ